MKKRKAVEEVLAPEENLKLVKALTEKKEDQRIEKNRKQRERRARQAELKRGDDFIRLLHTANELRELAQSGELSRALEKKKNSQ